MISFPVCLDGVGVGQTHGASMDGCQHDLPGADYHQIGKHGAGAAGCPPVIEAYSIPAHRGMRYGRALTCSQISEACQSLKDVDLSRIADRDNLDEIRIYSVFVASNPQRKVDADLAADVIGNNKAQAGPKPTTGQRGPPQGN